MTSNAEDAWAEYKNGPLFSPRGNTNHGATKRPFLAGYEAGVAAERERAARIADGYAESRQNYIDADYDRGWIRASKVIAAAIREEDR